MYFKYIKTNAYHLNYINLFIFIYINPWCIVCYKELVLIIHVKHTSEYLSLIHNDAYNDAYITIHNILCYKFNKMVTSIKFMFFLDLDALYIHILINANYIYTT